MIQSLHTTTLKHTPLTFILHTQLLSENDSFFMPNKPLLTNKIILHPPLCHPHNNHKHKHQTKMNIPLYNFMRKTLMILVKMRINSSLITSITKVMTKAMTRVLADQRYLCHLRCNFV